MEKHNKKLALYLLLLMASVLILLIGCVRTTPEKSDIIKKEWRCDSLADEAMKKFDYNMSISLHEIFLSRDPDNALAVYHLGYSYGQIGEIEKEVLLYLKAMSLGFNENHIFFNLGMVFGELNLINESIDAFKKAVELDPNNAEYHYGLALAYMNIKEYKLAEEGLLKVIEIDPKHQEAGSLLKQLYKDQRIHTILDYEPADKSYLKT